MRVFSPRSERRHNVPTFEAADRDFDLPAPICSGRKLESDDDQPKNIFSYGDVDQFRDSPW
jgi:hypothetical protein